MLGTEFKEIDGKVYLHQRKYINKLLKKFDVNICENVKVPMSVGINISKNSCPTSCPRKEIYGKFPISRVNQKPDVSGISNSPRYSVCCDLPFTVILVYIIGKLPYRSLNM
ncbi:hypothetical protein AVEN_72182-1 [Araneus ventricosus]|uniref:Reverse transcriptase Ty1/copia-type domain-containing protein n=1 Tax=Araneus ventricosus TaxID=182803 RepID=A0A4Y2EII2_ARAVE|nr:hypothetical protein AVEN_72182-1 [Araneus ventricosus]